MHGKAARIEVGKEDIEKAAALAGEIVSALKKIGFECVALDLEGCRPSGSRTRSNGLTECGLNGLRCALTAPLLKWQ